MNCPSCIGVSMNDVSESPHPDWPVLYEFPEDSSHKFFKGTWAMGMDEDVLHHVPNGFKPGFTKEIKASWKVREQVVYYFTPVNKK